jgi:ABC-type transport system involved in multi-copper enzyme maturation permease subunit
MKLLRLQRPSINPIIVKELRGRMRGARPYAVLTGFLLAMVGTGYAINWLITNQARFGGTVLSPQVGQGLFSGLAMVELLLVIFLAPALTSGAISGEREQLTYDLLLTTPLRPTRILWGKLVAALSYLFLLVFAAVPLFSVVLIFGGVEPRDMAKALLLLLVCAVFFGAIGLFFSALVQRTQRATVLSYTVTLLLLGLGVGAAGSWGALSSPPGQQVPPPLLYLNPFSAMGAVTTIVPNNGGGGLFPIGGDVLAYGGFSWQALLLNGVVWYGPNGASVLPVYRATLVFYPMFTLLLCWIGTHLVLPRRRWQPQWADVGFALAIGAWLLLAWLARDWWLVLLPPANG